MVDIVLYILLTILVMVVLALLFPIHIIVKGAGGTDTGFDGSGRVMLFAGLLGGGWEYLGKEFRAGLYIGSHRIYAIDAARFSRRERKKTAVKKPDEQKEKERKAALSKHEKEEREEVGFIGKVRHTLRRVRTYSLYAKIALREIKSLFRVDRFDAQITLGLDDPARTGQVMGILYAINGVLPDRFVIRPGGDFTRRVFSGSADIKVTFRTWLFWIRLVRVLWLFMRLRRQTKPVYREKIEAQEA
ncbi:MAG: DUF2953 domain-containing protein [Candidatus Latescibacterota bacterium]